MAIDVLNDDQKVKSATAVLSPLNSLNKKLQWLLEIEKAYIDSQNEQAHSPVEAEADNVEMNDINQASVEQFIDENPVINTGAELLNAYHVDTTASADTKSHNFMLETPLSQQMKQQRIPQEQLVSKSIEIFDALKKPLVTIKADYFNIGNKLNSSDEFLQVISDFSENKVHESVKLFTGSDGVQIVIKCEKILSDSYARMGHDIKNLLENRGNKVNSLIINGKALWSFNDVHDLNRPEFNVIY